ncbi:MAG: hypothetical protein AB1679_33475, partial [Actinomycetota bacterium]
MSSPSWGRAGKPPLGERDFMIRSRRAAIGAALLGALLVAGVPTLAYGEGDTAREAKAYSAMSTSEEVEAQKAKDEDGKKDEKKKADEKKADQRKSADNKKSG